MKLVDIIQGMTDQRVPLGSNRNYHWCPLWRVCHVRSVNGKFVISNRPY